MLRDEKAACAPGNLTQKKGIMTTATKPQQYQGWEGFAPGPWTEGIKVRDFVQRNYTPFNGDSSFLAGPTDKTLRVWDTL